jgi:hypothetical protein
MPVVSMGKRGPKIQFHDLYHRKQRELVQKSYLKRKGLAKKKKT